MKTFTFPRRVASCIAELAVVACAGSEVVTPAQPTTDHTILAYAASPTRLFAQVGTDVTPPTVILTFRSGPAVPGVIVRFTTSGGSIADTLVRTDDKGRASCGRWTLGPGDNVLVALAENADTTIYFHAYGRPVLGVVHDSYKLYSIGGVPLPILSPQWSIVGGEYLLADDGTFAVGEDVFIAGATQSNRTTGVYTRSDSTIRFAIDGSSLSTGTVHGDTLRVAYDDYMDSDPEVYIRLPAPPSANRVAAASVRKHQ